MDAMSMIRTLGALGMVLGMLAAALWVVRRYDLKLPGRVTTTRRKRVELVERLSVDAKRSVALIRRDDRVHLILIGPDGNTVIESGIADEATAEAGSDPQPAPPPVFAALVEPRLVADDQPARAPIALPRLRMPANFKLPAMFERPAAPPVATRPAPSAPKPRRQHRERRPFGYSARWNRALAREAGNA